MEIRLLGPLELVAPDGSMELGSSRSRAVLAALALQANRVTTVDQLVDAVWDSAPPATARAQIRICISDLRRAFRDARIAAAIETRPSGYLLEIGPSELDTTEFDRLVAVARDQAASADCVRAVATLRTAEELWRGPALSGVSGPTVQAAAARLNDARLVATEERIRLELELGRHQSVIGELRALVEREPLRESLHRMLMLALYRAGRQAEALEVYQRTRSLLVEELGVEPGPELRDLHAAVLDRSPSLDLEAPTAAPPARQLPASIADFTGREEELAALRQYLGDTRGQTSYGLRIVGLSGPGGVGKSTLAIRAAHELAGAFPDGQLYADVRATGGTDAAMATLDRFLRALGVPGPAIPQDRQARTELYRSRLAGRRMLVVLDDVTDEADVMPLLPGDAACGVIATSRTRLSGVPGAYLLDVHMLDVDRSVRLLSRLLGAARVATQRESTRELAEQCAGLPLALRISAARLAAHPHWQLTELVSRLRDETHRLDELAHRNLELRATIALSYQAIDDEARRLFRLFALTGTLDAPPWTAAALLDTDLATARHALDRLAAAQLITVVRYDDSRGLRYQFHSLVRVYAAERLADTEPPSERDAALGRLLSGWLALAEDAHRHEYGGDHTVIHGSAARWRPDVADPHVDAVSDPMGLLDRERAALVAAVGRAAAEGLDELCWDLALTLVTLFEVKGYIADWESTSTTALEVAERAGNRLGQAAMHYSLGSLHSEHRRLDRASQLLESAVQQFRTLGHGHGTGLALRNLAVVDRFRGDLPAARSHGQEALGLLRSAGDPVGEAHLLSRLALVEHEDGNLPAAQRLADESLELNQRTGYRRGVAQALYVSAMVQAQADDLVAARRTQEQVLDLVRELDDQVGTVYALLALGDIERRAGRPQRALEVLRQATDRARSLGQTFLVRRAEDALDAIGDR